MKPDTGREYMKALSRHGIPYYTVGESGFFEIPEIAGILATLKALSNPNDDLSLAIALMSPVVGLDINEMSMLKFRAKDSGKHIHEVLCLLQETDVVPGRWDRLQKFHRALERYLPIRSLIRPSQLAEKLLEDLDYPAFLAAEDRTGRKTANLRKFIITAQRLDEAGVSLPELIRMLDKGGLDDEEQAAIESEETDAVKIMTVHKAKGLEFPIVIVGDTSWGQMNSTEPLLFEKNEQDICFTLNCRDEIQSCETFLSRLNDEEKNRNLEEEKRSLYVATTRASDMLVMTFRGQKNKYKQHWKDLMLGNLLEINEVGVELAPAFKDLVEVITAPAVESAPNSFPSGRVCLETKYIEPVVSEAFKKDVSPTAIIEASIIGGKPDFEDDEILEEINRDRRLARGLLAHQVMESLGNDHGLEELCSESSPGNFMGIEEAEVQEVLRRLLTLKDHPLVKEMQSALDLRNEYQIFKPFTKYMLSARLDKVIKTADGWKILDFKFSDSKHHSEAYEFQMKFYLYIAREIFSPLFGAELFYLMDGRSIKVKLDDDSVRDFEKDLLTRIECYQEAIRRTPLPLSSACSIQCRGL
jgi:ATP-dependent helicase/nuclease subunit A